MHAIGVSLTCQICIFLVTSQLCANRAKHLIYRKTLCTRYQHLNHVFVRILQACSQHRLCVSILLCTTAYITCTASHSCLCTTMLHAWKCACVLPTARGILHKELAASAAAHEQMSSACMHACLQVHQVSHAKDLSAFA